MIKIVFSVLLLVTIQSSAQTFLGEKDRTVYDVKVKGEILCALTKSSVELWDLKNKMLITSTPHRLNGIPTVITFADDSVTLAVGSRAGEVLILNTITGTSSHIEAGLGVYGAVTSIDVSKERRLLAVGFSNGKYSVYNIITAKELYSGTSESDITSLQFSLDDKWLFVGSAKGEIFQLSTSNLSVVRNIIDNKWITAIAMNSDSVRMSFVTSSGIKTIRIDSTDHSQIMKLRSSWFTDHIINLDCNTSKVECYAYSTIGGKVVILVSQINRYVSRLHVVINQVRFIDERDGNIVVAVATRGRGLQIIKASDMKLDQ